jgi:GH24 family phage-related lysozyme (muramidase)
MPGQVSQQTKKTVGVLLGGNGTNQTTSKVNSIPPKISTAKKIDTVDPSLSGMSAVDLLGSIFQELKKQEIERKFESELNRRFQEETNTEEELRNRELIKAITGRRPAKKVEESKTRAKKEEPTEVPKVTKPAAPKAPQVKPPTQTAPKAPQVKPPTQTAPKAPQVKPPTQTAPKAPEVKPPTVTTPKPPTTATKTPAVTAPKAPPTPPKVSGAPVIPAAAKVAVGAVAAGGFFALASSVIAKEEGLPKNGKAYWDPPGQNKLVSIGYGHQIKPEEYKQGFIQAGDEKILIKGEKGIDTSMTPQQAKKLLEIDLPKYVERAKKPLSNSWEKLTDEQKTALTSYAYNVGSTVSLVNAGLKTAIDRGDTQEAAKIISEKGIRTANGKFNAALDKRRKKEAELFASTKIKELPPPLTTVTQSSGTKINNASVENTQLHESLNNTRPQVIVNQTTETNSKTNRMEDKSTPQDDRPVWKKK